MCSTQEATWVPPALAARVRDLSRSMHSTAGAEFHCYGNFKFLAGHTRMHASAEQLLCARFCVASPPCICLAALGLTTLARHVQKAMKAECEM